MKFNTHKLVMLIVVLLPLSLFVFPMWKISLYAPQYPDGVTMYIWINDIKGETPGTLQNINILNHYVGMKPIVPSDFKELTYFPIVISVMVLFGVILTLWGKKKYLMIWSIGFLLLALLGVYDFYMWEYDYGHDLDPSAPIKVPGMAYQPPLIGKKRLLNFDAYSYPGISTYLTAISIMIPMITYWIKRKK